jgi:hypothetical protein
MQELLPLAGGVPEGRGGISMIDNPLRGECPKGEEVLILFSIFIKILFQNGKEI